MYKKRAIFAIAKGLACKIALLKKMQKSVCDTIFQNVSKTKNGCFICFPINSKKVNKNDDVVRC